jgi:hypothetical protein
MGMKFGLLPIGKNIVYENECWEEYMDPKITESLGNVTVRGEKRWKEQVGSTMANSLSMYSIRLCHGSGH